MNALLARYPRLMELFRRFNLSTTQGGGVGWPLGGGPLPPPFPPPGGPGGPAPDTPQYFNMGDNEDSDNVDTNGDGDDDDAGDYNDDDDGNDALGALPVYISDPDRFEANTVPASSSKGLPPGGPGASAIPIYNAPQQQSSASANYIVNPIVDRFRDPRIDPLGPVPLQPSVFSSSWARMLQERGNEAWENQVMKNMSIILHTVQHSMTTTDTNTQGYG